MSEVPEDQPAQQVPSPQSNIQAMVQNTVNAENNGVTVDWKTTCINTYNAAIQEITRLNAEIDVLQKEAAAEA